MTVSQAVSEAMSEAVSGFDFLRCLQSIADAPVSSSCPLKLGGEVLLKRVLVILTNEYEAIKAPWTGIVSIAE